MQTYINKALLTGIHVKEKQIADWVKFQKAKPEKRIFNLIVYRIATGDGWIDKNSVLYHPYTLEEFRAMFGQHYSLDSDGITMIIKPSITLYFTNKNTETAFFDTYKAAVLHARYIAGQNLDLLKFGE